MGRFLAIGLATKIFISKSDTDEANLTIEQLQEKMVQQLHFVPEIYSVSDTEDGYLFELKNDILQSQLIPFLETFYPLLYSSFDHYSKALEELKKHPASEWLQIAEDNSLYVFQLDEYGMRDNYCQIL